MGRRSKRQRAVYEQGRDDGGTGFGSKLECVQPGIVFEGIDVIEEPDYHLLDELENIPEALNTIKSSLPPTFLSRISGYDGSSRTTMWRKRKETERIMKACPMRKITSFFPQKVEEESKALPVVVLPSEQEINRVAECFDKIDSILSDTNVTLPRREMVQFMAILQCLRYRIKGLGKVASAEKASQCIAGRSSRTGRCIMNWTNVYLKTMELPVSRQGKHQKTLSIIQDEDAVSMIVDWLHETSKVNRSPEKMCGWINDVLLPELAGSEVRSISVRRVRDLMNSLGYKYGIWKKGVYFDGHERQDVVAYRQQFLQRIIPLLNDRMSWWSGPDMEQKLERHNTEDLEVVWVSHDESVFYSNDDGGKGWGSEENPDIHKKGKGRSIMVSDFIIQIDIIQ